MTRILLSLLICGIIFAGCSNSSSENKETENPIPQLPDQAVVDSSASQAPTSTDAASLQTPTSAPQGTSAPVTMPAQNTQNINASATGMNPAHGEPGHRCDIAVGAPLNSPPGKPPVVSSPTINTTPQSSMPPSQPTFGSTPSPTPVNVNSAPSQTVTAPGMNPPHGQPGHDCSVAVGAPLKK